jgi:putative RNA 2'-phosphotransferase
MEKENSEVVRISKFLSQILRHQPGKIGLTLDPNGWADVTELLEKSAQKGMKFDRATLQIVVDTNNKKRFSLSDDGLRIRANQGHSVVVDLELQPQNPPEILFYGTVAHNLASIRQNGLSRMKRQHVHLSHDVATAEMVGGRRGKAVILSIKSGEMSRAGHLFFCSENGVWLTESVPSEFIVF